jgi:hypothetical protein
LSKAVPDLKLDELKQGPGQPAQPAGPGASGPGTAARVGAARLARWGTGLRGQSTTGAAQLWRGHRLFIIVAALSLLPRILAALAYRPALLTSDSFLYMRESLDGKLGVIRPSGYSLYLLVFHELPHPLLLVTTVQHLMGIAIAAIVYGLLRHWGLPAWGASLAALPTLIDPRQMALESYVLPDTVYTLSILVVVALVIRRGRPKLWQCGLAGLLMAYVTVLRGNGLPLAVVVALYLLVRRVGWRSFVAGAVAFVIPVLGYVLTFHAQNGVYNLTNSDGEFLWSRTTSFANCAVIKPAADLKPLCPHGGGPAPKAPAWSIPALLDSKSPNDYLWKGSGWWRTDAHPGINAYNSKLGEKFAKKAIEAQPLGYLHAVAEDVGLLFLRNDRPQTLTTISFTTQQHIAHLPGYYAKEIKAYARTTSNTHIVQPYAYFLFLFEMPVYFPGILFAAAFVAGAIGLIRRRRDWGGPGLLPWVMAVAGILLPAMLSQLLYRYALSAVPLACLAAGFAFVYRPTRPALATAGSAPAPGTSAAPPASLDGAATTTAAAPERDRDLSVQDDHRDAVWQDGGWGDGPARPEDPAAGTTRAEPVPGPEAASEPAGIGDRTREQPAPDESTPDEPSPK